MLLSHADPRRGREALAALDFSVHADLFMNPSAAFADIVLPAASPFERETLRGGFDDQPRPRRLGCSSARRPCAPVGEARSDARIVLDLAVALGLGADFRDGDLEAAWRGQLAPTGLTLEALRAAPGGLDLPLATRHRKYAAGRLRHADAQGADPCRGVPGPRPGPRCPASPSR